MEYSLVKNKENYIKNCKFYDILKLNDNFS